MIGAIKALYRDYCEQYGTERALSQGEFRAAYTVLGGLRNGSSTLAEAVMQTGWQSHSGQPWEHRADRPTVRAVGRCWMPEGRRRRAGPRGGTTVAAAKNTQIIVVSHSPLLIKELTSADLCTRLHLLKDFGETKLDGSTLFNTPKWNWPHR